MLRPCEQGFSTASEPNAAAANSIAARLCHRRLTLVQSIPHGFDDDAQTPDGPQVFLHRDFHPGNVLWQRGTVTGVVDWPVASTGPPSADVGHCRANLFPYGGAAVGRFTREWENLTGATYHPWADIVTIVGNLDGLREEAPAPEECRLIEDVLAQAVTALG